MKLKIVPGADPTDPAQIRLFIGKKAVEGYRVLTATHQGSKRTLTVLFEYDDTEDAPADELAGAEEQKE